MDGHVHDSLGKRRTACAFPVVPTIVNTPSFAESEIWSFSMTDLKRNTHTYVTVHIYKYVQLLAYLARESCVVSLVTVGFSF